mmetsp:Transcript_55902/g.120951  ORF Transcript_55902/g.120951 Transcript_55902/m.120951 type:complete len:575 (+) Transcript_55902:58-1782(+)
MKVLTGGSPSTLNIPNRFVEGSETEGFRWVVLKVDQRSRDGIDALRGASLRLLPNGQVELIPGAGYEGKLLLHYDTESEAAHLLPLIPHSLGSNKLTVNEKPITLVRIVCRTKPLSGEPKIAEHVEGAKSISLKPVACGEGESVLLGHWHLGRIDFNDEGRGQLRFRCYDVNDRRRLIGKFLDAPKMMLYGNSHKRRTKMDMKVSWRYLIGGLWPGAKATRVYEADLFVINRDPESFGGLDVHTANEGKTYSEQQRAAILGFAIAKTKKKYQASERRNVSLSEGASVDAQGAAALKELQKRAVAQNVATPSVQKQEMDLRMQTVPAFRKDAETPELIYAEGLEEMVPRSMLQTEHKLDYSDMAALLQRPPNEVLAMSTSDLLRLCRNSGMVLAVVRGRAEKGLIASVEGSTLLARRFGVLWRLMELYQRGQFRNGIFKVGSISKFLDLPVTSALLTHWFETFCEPTQDPVSRKVVTNKVLCHALIWALNLCPGCSLDFSPACDSGASPLQVERLIQYLKYLGCRCESTAVEGGLRRLEGRLVAPLSIESAQHFGKRPRGRGGGGRGSSKGKDTE